MSQARKTEMSYLRPGAGEWQLCAGASDGRITEEAVLGSLTEVDTHMCVLPVAALTVCPLWLRSTDDSFLESAIRLQLEKRNLLPETSSGQLIASRSVCREENQVLVLVMILSVGKLQELNIDKIKADQFSVSPLSFDLPANALVVWRELGRDVVAFTRDGQVAHFQGLVSSDDQSRTLELACLAMQLESEGIIHPVAEIVLLSLKSGDRDLMVSGLESRVGFRPKIVTELDLKNEIETVDLLPPVEEERRQLAGKQSRRHKFALAMAALYFVVLLSLGARLFWLQQIVDSSEERQAFLATKVADVRETKVLWQQIQGAVDPDEYPLEILALCVEAVPSNGVQLTEFGVNSAGKIILAGQADSVPMALAFKSALTGQVSLSRYDWKFPQPHNRKKGPGAVFKATGTRNDYVTN